ncbi:MAG TPA: hypothetical protein VGB97_04745 [Candidatus Paceibacterota bacterium]|jgi:hypothetical protein
METTNDVRLVGKPSKLPLIILGLLVLALLGYLLWHSGKAQEGAEQGQQQMQQQVGADVRDIAGVYGVTNTADLHNRNLALEDVTVSRVISDRLFYVHQGNEAQPLLVYLADRLDEGENEGGVRIQVGQKLSVSGELKDVSQAGIDEGDDYAADEVGIIRGERVYLEAKRTNS